MTVTLLVDSNNNISFVNKRLSQDSVITNLINESVPAGTEFIMNAYSAKLFNNPTTLIRVMERPLENAPKGSFVLVENDAERINDPDIIDKIDKLQLINWGRSYPGTLKLKKETLAKFKLAGIEVFRGNSHDEVTWEVYEK